MHSGVPSAVVGSIVQAVKSIADADDVRRVDAGLGQQMRHRLLERSGCSRRDPAAPSRARGAHRRPGAGRCSSMTPLL